MKKTYAVTHRTSKKDKRGFTKLILNITLVGSIPSRVPNSSNLRYKIFGELSLENQPSHINKQKVQDTEDSTSYSYLMLV